MVPTASYFDLACASTRAEFVRACPFPLLVGSVTLVRPRMPQPTLSGAIHDFDGDQPQTVNVTLPEMLSRTPAVRSLLVLAVRKIQPAFPTMITVGRTANNDLVVNDVQVSKFHAFFRSTNGRYELADAGSRNGTMVAGRPVVPRGPGLVARLGDAIQIAHLQFTLLDAGGCWDLIMRLRATPT